MGFEPDIFLTKTEKKELSVWKNKNEDFTITSFIFKPIYRFISKFIPESIAPNVITLSAFLCVINGYYLCFRYMDYYPNYVSVFALILSYLYQFLDGCDSIHAKRTQNESNLGHILSQFSHVVGVIFQVLTLCYILDIRNLSFQWYYVQIILNFLFILHINGFKTGVVKFYMFFGGNEILTIFELIIFLRITGIVEPIYHFYTYIFFPFVEKYVTINSKYINGIKLDPQVLLILFIVRYIYFLTCLITIVMILSLPKKKNETRNSLLIVYGIRLIPALLLYFTPFEIDNYDVLSDGLFMSLVISDLILSKMCDKQLHPWIILFSVSSLISNVVIIFLAIFYYVVILFEVSSYLNLPIFSININVYIDGVFDMCHYGHFKYFERASKRGTRLFVGVLSDEDVMDYKRKPVLSLEERVNVVSTCKSVYKVIAKCPYPGIPLDFIQKHNINKVLCSPEYTDPKDIYYKVPRDLGILEVMPRTKGMSTSTLIKRIVSRGEIKNMQKKEEEGEKGEEVKIINKNISEEEKPKIIEKKKDENNNNINNNIKNKTKTE